MTNVTRRLLLGMTLIGAGSLLSAPALAGVNPLYRKAN